MEQNRAQPCPRQSTPVQLGAGSSLRQPGVVGLPSVEGRALAALRESVRLHGVLEPIVVSAGPARPGSIADGQARELIAEQLSLECPRVERPFGSDAEFRLFRLTVNVKRRQLSQAELIRLARELEPLERELAAARRAQARGGRRGEKSLPVWLPEERGESRDRLGAAIGMSGASYQRGARVLAEGSPELVARFERGQETVNSAFRKLQAEQQRQENRELARWLREHPPPWPEGRWSVLVIDPPWPLECALPYPTMSLEEIAAVPVADLVAEDAIVWLWTTNSFLLKAGAIGEGWGLRYDTKLEWIKDKLGTGQTLRGQSEPCLVFKRGRPLIDLTTESTVLSAAVREHSRKPAEFYEQVETLCPGNKLELFAREARPGWDRWGAEPDKYPGLEGK